MLVRLNALFSLLHIQPNYDHENDITKSYESRLQCTSFRSKIGLDYLGLDKNEEVYWNLNPSELYEHAILHGEAILTADHALLVHTGKYTGRSPKDRFIIKQPSIQDEIDW